MTDDIPNEIPLGKVTLGRKIGEGGFGQVFEAYQHPFNRKFAIKLLNPHPFNAPGSMARKRFEKEANILLSLRHEYITPIYGVGEYDGQPYILMEYFAGVDLHKARDMGTPSPELVLPFMEHVTSALDYAHRCEIVHRDIKPSNLLTMPGDARVVDFGIAQALDPEGERLTKVGATPVGGDVYAAPELIKDPRLLDPRCDIFSLGACWFWLLTGTSPKGRNWEFALRQIGSMTPEYESVILKTLDQVDARYQSMAELLIEIRALRSGDSPKAVEGELDDDTVAVLGVAFEQYLPETEAISVYMLEQRVSQVMNRFTFSIALSALNKYGFIDFVELEDRAIHETYKAVVVTDLGQEWVQLHRSRVAGLIPEDKKKTEDKFDDDIPF